MDDDSDDSVDTGPVETYENGYLKSLYVRVWGSWDKVSSFIYLFRTFLFFE